KYLESNVLPEMPPSVQSKFYEAIQTERLRSMPNSFLPPSTNTNEGLIMLGDAMNMRHPLTGGGMTVGLNDVVTLVKLLSPSEVSDFVYTGLILEKMEDFHWKRKQTSSVINVLAQALYALFAASDESTRIARRLLSLFLPGWQLYYWTNQSFIRYMESTYSLQLGLYSSFL
ncbi:1041_t:CDS:2, partial [Paraglomus occultum]